MKKFEKVCFKILELLYKIFWIVVMPFAYIAIRVGDLIENIKFKLHKK
jgi:hypothetical protein